MAKLKRAMSTVSHGMALDQVWKDFVVYPDLKGVSTQAAEGRPLNLVPLVDFESKVWGDTTLRCIRCAELVAEGHDRPKTFEEFVQLERRIKSEEDERSAVTRRLKELNDPTVRRDPQFGPQQVKRVRRASAYLQSHKGKLSFFTGTLSPEHLERVAWCANGWGKAMTNFRRSLSQKCRRKGLPDFALDVTEIQMDRYSESGEPAPHVHLVFVNKIASGFWQDWIVSKEELQGMWDSAIHNVVGECLIGVSNRTKTVSVEKDVFGYLRKYFSKGDEVDSIDWTVWVGAKPQQWCSVSGGLRRAMKAVSPEVTGVFMEWLNINSRNFAGRGFYHFKEWCPDDMPIGSLAEVQFYSPEALLTCFVRFVDDLRRNLAHLSGLPYKKLDPVAALGLPIPPADLEAKLPRTFPVGSPAPVTKDLRERLDILFVNSQISEPVFGALDTLLEKESTEVQLDVFRAVTRQVLECHLGAEGCDE